MDFSNWVARNQNKLGSEYEILFATKVLPLVECLQCEAVTAQYPFEDSEGRPRYCDFTIIESDTVRVAIEIDGYDKRGTGTGMSYEEFLDWQRRQASLAAMGWHVLRFANRDVRDAPHRCAEHISNLLNRLRQAQIGRVEIVTIQSKPPENGIALAKVDAVRPPGIRPKKNYKPFFLVALCIPVAFALWQKHKEDPVPPIVALQTIPGDTLPLEYVAMEVPPPKASSAGTLAAVDRSVPAIPVNNHSVGKENSYGGLDCRRPLDWSVAKEHVGQVVTIIGPLLTTKARPDVTGRPMWLDIGSRYPNQNRLTVVVWGGNWSKFDTSELDAESWFRYSDEVSYASLCTRGKISVFKGIPQIELQDPSQVRIWLGPETGYGSGVN